MTKLNWDKNKRWKEPAYSHLPLNEYLEQYNQPPSPYLSHLYEWDMDKYRETMKRERDEEIKQQIRIQAAKQAKAHHRWLNTLVHCQGCGKKRTPKQQHTITCDTKKLQKYGWHYGEPYPTHSEETLAKQAAQKAYRQTPEYKEELKRRRNARKRRLTRARNKKEAKNNG
tara:strand:+ start:137 stop:646 length:510 start_codon:yes stop_codon:yes gene_type:complete